MRLRPRPLANSAPIYECLSNQLGVRYQYKDIDQIEQVSLELTPAMFAVLPQELRKELIEALERLDTERIEQAIKQTASYDFALQKTLNHFAEDFDYPTILKVLKELN